MKTLKLITLIFVCMGIWTVIADETVVITDADDAAIKKNVSGNNGGENVINLEFQECAG